MPRSDDMLSLEHGIYVWAENPDEFGPRAFMTLNLFWNDQDLTFLTDAATHWGLAPWALFQPRKSMQIHSLGTWGQFVSSHPKSLSFMNMATREKENFHTYGGLLIVRACLKFEALSKSKNVGIDVARYCLNQELERDSIIRDAKAHRYTLENPGWSTSTMSRNFT